MTQENATKAAATWPNLRQEMLSKLGRSSAPSSKIGPYATDDVGAPERYIPPTTNAGAGMAMITPVKPKTDMNQLIRKARR